MSAHLYVGGSGKDRLVTTGGKLAPIVLKARLESQ